MDRCRAVVVALRGTATVEDVVTDSVADPVPLAGCLPEAFAKQHEGAVHSFYVHAGIEGAANAVLRVRLPLFAWASDVRAGAKAVLRARPAASQHRQEHPSRVPLCQCETLVHRAGLHLRLLQLPEAAHTSRQCLLQDLAEAGILDMLLRRHNAEQAGSLSTPGHSWQASAAAAAVPRCCALPQCLP